MPEGKNVAPGRWSNITILKDDGVSSIIKGNL